MLRFHAGPLLRSSGAAAGSSRGISTPLRLLQVVAHATNLPHHRHPDGVHYASGLPPLPLAQQRRRRTQQQRRPAGAAAESDDDAALPGLAELQSIAAWLRSGEWQQALAAQRPLLRAALQARVTALSAVLARAYAHASAAWRHVLACWPAWRASLQHDAEVVMEYALGLLPAWLAAARAGLAAACRDLLAAAAPHVAPLAAATSAAVRAARQDAQRLCQAVEERVQAAAARPAPTRPPPRPTPPPLQQQPPVKHAAGDEARLRVAAGKGAKVEVACGGLFWFGGSATASAKAKSTSGSSSSQGALATLQQLQDNMTAQSDALLYSQHERPRRWKAPQRRGWADDVVTRALARGSMPGSSVAQPSGGPWRLLHHGRRQQQQQQHSAAPLFGLNLTGLAAAQGAVAASAQRGVASLAAAPEALVAAAQRSVTGVVANSQAVAARGAQQCRSVLAAPLQLASAPKAPTVLASLAAASLLAGAAAQALQHTRDQGTQQQLQQQQASQKQEALRAQKARILGALQQSQAADAAGPNGRKRTPAFEAAAALGTATTAGGVLGDDAQDADSDESPAGAEQLAPQELDPEAAALWKQFLSGSRTVGVPMWDNHMREDAPTKASQREVERQTQKIRSAVAGQDRAALEEADMEQLEQQLQALTAAPMGRAARAAWLREKKEHEAAGGVEGSQEEGARRKRSASRADNPFVISPEARAQWDADGDAAGGSKGQPAAVGASANAAGAARPPSRPASRSARGDSPAGNPFAVAGEVRARWEAEDSEYSDATPRSSQQSQQQGGGLLGGLLALLGGGDRRGSSSGGGSQPAAARQQRPQQQRRRSARAPPAGVDGGVLEVPLPLPAGVEGAARKKARVAAPAAGGLAKGSPEFDALRSEMLKAGAARRARLQQQQQQQQPAPAAASTGGGGSGSSSEAVPTSRRRAAADDTTTAPSSSSSSSDLAAAVSMQDALDVTVEPRVVPSGAAPASGGAAGQQAATAAPANRLEEMVKRDTSPRL